MKTARPQNSEASAHDKRDFITHDSLKARLQAGEIVTATDYDESIRPQFWTTIAIVQDDMPAVKSSWWTTDERHIDGLRIRQRVFAIRPRQKGVIDATLAALIVFAVVGIVLLAGGAL
ncbi:MULTISPECIES: hypothetical protein [Candidatus Accumulibacter]|uniref:Uncharacterized protein n=2 Tax=Candidatus Accumulibacter TaxID=327159 RepID=A0A080M852_9PROT|nr:MULTISPECIES: hypothetical protein [Candidatus Accumulibacter]KFB76645.1 MAG: hypothetical protein AW06_002285 [Candidatus Accumulibacter cognatus]MBL8402485.1 hypothetical protein [Accumulibacter sp.]QLH51227.1 MAG: hypothetical protein HWD57_16540 [Candidatus Accumulibacter cognatus]